MNRYPVTEQELLDAIATAMQRSPENPAGALTTEEIAEQFEMSDKRARKFIRALLEETPPRIECVNVYRKTITGVRTARPAFRLLGGPDVEPS